MIGVENIKGAFPDKISRVEAIRYIESLRPLFGNNPEVFSKLLPESVKDVYDITIEYDETGKTITLMFDVVFGIHIGKHIRAQLSYSTNVSETNISKLPHGYIKKLNEVMTKLSVKDEEEY